VTLERGREGLVDIALLCHERTTACSNRKRPGTLAFLRVLEQIGQLPCSLTCFAEPNLGFDEVTVEPEIVAQAMAPGGEHLGRRCQPLDRAGGVASCERIESQRPARPHDVPAGIHSTRPVSHPTDEGSLCRLALAYRRVELSAAALDAVERELANAAPSRYAASGAILHRLREDHARWLREAGRIERGRTATARALDGAPDRVLPSLLRQCR